MTIRVVPVLSLLILTCAAVASLPAPPCPCANVSLCEPVGRHVDKEVFIFRVDAKQDYTLYDWTVVSTIAEFTSPNSDLMCYAHARGVRVVGQAVGFDVAQLDNTTAQAEWVQANVDKCTGNFYDGINVDIESPLAAAQAPLLTALVAKLRAALDAQHPGYQLSFDVAWDTGCIDGRCYDFAGLGQTTDLLFIMDYDTQSQIFPPRVCAAYANSPLPFNKKSLADYLSIAPAEKLVLGVPWYGYKYTCVVGANATFCPIRHQEWRGVNCSDAVGSEVAYDIIMAQMARGNISALWDPEAEAPYFMYFESDSATGQQMQMSMRYDNPKSLTIKYELARELGIRGVGMWNADQLDYSGGHKPTPQTAAMWAALHTFTD